MAEARRRHRSDAVGAALVDRLARQTNDRVRIVLAPGPDVVDELAPVACLPKPFELAQLESALTTAVAAGASRV